MSEENKLKFMADDELADVAGGGGYLVDKGGGNYDYYFACPSCGTSQLITSSNTSIRTKVDGTFVCEKCGYTKSFQFGPYGGL